MVEKVIRDGICHSINRYAKVNNNYKKDYDKNKEFSYIKYWQYTYKILNNALYLNKTLFRFRKTLSPLCSFCKFDNKTLIHLFSRLPLLSSTFLALSFLQIATFDPF